MGGGEWAVPWQRGGRACGRAQRRERSKGVARVPKGRGIGAPVLKRDKSPLPTLTPTALKFMHARPDFLREVVPPKDLVAMRLSPWAHEPRMQVAAKVCCHWRSCPAASA